VYVTSVGPPPRVYVYEETPLGPVEVGTIDLPSDSDPGSASFGEDGYLYVVDHAQQRIFVISPFSGRVVDTIGTPVVQFITGYIQLYHALVQAARATSAGALLDFGDGFSAGSVWSGLNFGMRLDMPDTITPNGGDLLITGKPAKGQIPDELLISDANNNQLVRVSDSATPSFLGTIGGLPGTPGLQPVRGIDVGPLNLNSDVLGIPVYPIYITIPDIGAFASAGPNGPWIQIPATGIGHPSQVGADCETIGISSFNPGVFTMFRKDEPKGSHCEELVEMRVKSSVAGTFSGKLEAFVDGTARISASGGAPGEHREAYAAKKRKKLRLTAGRLTKFKFPLPAAVQAKLRAHKKVVVKVKIRLTSPAGETAKVIRKVKIR
jgi:hypothetical protein